MVQLYCTYVGRHRSLFSVPKARGQVKLLTLGLCRSLGVSSWGCTWTLANELLISYLLYSLEAGVRMSLSSLLPPFPHSRSCQERSGIAMTRYNRRGGASSVRTPLTAWKTGFCAACLCRNCHGLFVMTPLLRISNSSLNCVPITSPAHIFTYDNAYIVHKPKSFSLNLPSVLPFSPVWASRLLFLGKGDGITLLGRLC